MLAQPERVVGHIQKIRLCLEDRAPGGQNGAG